MDIRLPVSRMLYRSDRQPVPDYHLQALKETPARPWEEPVRSTSEAVGCQSRLSIDTMLRGKRHGYTADTL